jgi:DUF2933 family protein
MPGHDPSGHDTPASAHHEQGTRRAPWVFAGFAAIALVLLFTEHRAHVLGLLPWLFLLACPLMHLFMHGGHGGHGHGGRPDQGEEK